MSIEEIKPPQAGPIGIEFADATLAEILGFLDHKDFPHVAMPECIRVTVAVAEGSAEEGQEGPVEYQITFSFSTVGADPEWFVKMGVGARIAALNPRGNALRRVDLVVKHIRAREKVKAKGTPLVMKVGGNIVPVVDAPINDTHDAGAHFTIALIVGLFEMHVKNATGGIDIIR